MNSRGLKEELGIRYDPESEAHEGLLLLGSPAAHAWERIIRYAKTLGVEPREIVSAAVNMIRGESWQVYLVRCPNLKFRQTVDTIFWDDFEKIVNEEIPQAMRKNFLSSYPRS